MGKILKQENKINLRPFTGSTEEGILYTVLSLTNQCLKVLNKICFKFKLSVAKLNVLRILDVLGADFKKKEKGVPQTVISKHLFVSSPDVTGIINRMAKAKLIIRRKDQYDKRQKLISITPKGKEFLEKAWPVYKKEIHEHTKTLTSAEKEKLYQLLSKLNKGF